MKKSILLLAFTLAAFGFQVQAGTIASAKKGELIKTASHKNDTSSRLQAAFEHFNADLTIIQVRFKHDPIKESHLSQKAYLEYQEKVKSIIGAEQSQAFQAGKLNR